MDFFAYIKLFPLHHHFSVPSTAIFGLALTPRQCNLISFDGSTDAGSYSPEPLALKACLH